MNPAPHDLDAERAVLASCLLHASVRKTVTNDVGVTPADFYLPGHGQVFAAMLDLDAQGSTVDALLVARHARLDLEHIEGLIVFAPATKDIRSHAQRVKAVATRRAKWIAAQELLAALDAEDDDAAAVAEGQFTAAQRHDTTSLSAEQLGSRLLDWLAEKAPPAISTGFPVLDRNIGGGMRPGDTTVVAAWTSWGKSALADTILTNAAREGHRCHVYVNEMSDVDRGLRMLARETGVPYPRIAVKNLDAADLAAVVDRAAHLPFGLTDCAGWTADRVARDILAQRWDVACLDLLHNMPHRDEKDLSAAIVTLTAAALRARTHLIVVCQLNDARAQGGRLPQPVTRDVRGSNMIRNSAANVLLLHRDQEEQQMGVVELLPEGALVAGKARHGRIGAQAPVRFDYRSMSFREVFVGGAA